MSICHTQGSALIKHCVGTVLLAQWRRLLQPVQQQGQAGTPALANGAASGLHPVANGNAMRDPANQAGVHANGGYPGSAANELHPAANGNAMGNPANGAGAQANGSYHTNAANGRRSHGAANEAHTMANGNGLRRVQSAVPMVSILLIAAAVLRIRWLSLDAGLHWSPHYMLAALESRLGFRDAH